LARIFLSGGAPAKRAIEFRTKRNPVIILKDISYFAGGRHRTITDVGSVRARDLHRPEALKLGGKLNDCVHLGCRTVSIASALPSAIRIARARVRSLATARRSSFSRIPYATRTRSALLSELAHLVIQGFTLVDIAFRDRSPSHSPDTTEHSGTTTRRSPATPNSEASHTDGPGLRAQPRHHNHPYGHD
jgi:hypothetical protein